jgi:hypothetical protein
VNFLNCPSEPTPICLYENPMVLFSLTTDLYSVACDELKNTEEVKKNIAATDEVDLKTDEKCLVNLIPLFKK